MSVPETTPQMTRWCALMIGAVCTILFGATAISVVHAERTGIAYYSPNAGTTETEPVTRERNPHQFSLAMTYQGFHLILAGSLAIASFWFYRRLGN